MRRMGSLQFVHAENVNCRHLAVPKYTHEKLWCKQVFELRVLKLKFAHCRFTVIFPSFVFCFEVGFLLSYFSEILKSLVLLP